MVMIVDCLVVQWNVLNPACTYIHSYIHTYIHILSTDPVSASLASEYGTCK